MKKIIKTIYLLIFIFILFGCDSPTTMGDTTQLQSSDLTIEQFLVTFESMGGTNVESVYVNEHNSVTLPIVQKEGYRLEGWYTSSDGGQTLDTKWNFETDLADKDLTLYAKWQVNQYTLSFIEENGNVLYSYIFNYNEDLSSIEIPIPIKEGYAFDDWNQALPQTMPAINVTITAKWVINEYNITFSINGSESVEPIKQGFNSIIDEPNVPTKEGYYFDAWYTSTDNGVTFDKKWLFDSNVVTDNMTLYANFVPDGLQFDILSGTITGYLGNLEELIIPSKINDITVMEIGVRAFQSKNLTNVIIPNSITTIGDSAFANNHLTSVEIPINVMIIDIYAFYNNQLSMINLPNNVITIGGAAFANNILTSITIPDSVITIGGGAFANNTLTSVTIPSGVTTIENGAFRDNELTYVSIPESVTTIGSSAFAYNDLTSINIPHGLTILESGVFRGNKLTSITIPSGVTTIKSTAFGSNLLTSLIVPVGVTVIEERAFEFNNIASLTIPNTVTTIGLEAFQGNKLTNLVIPNSVTSIGRYAFALNRLTSLIIMNGITTIEDATFAFNNLTNVIIPSSVTTISSWAFAENSLTSITIPSDVTTIGEFAFGENNFNSVTILGDETRFNDNWESIGFPETLKPV